MTSTTNPDEFAQNVEAFFKNMINPDYKGWDADIHNVHARFESATPGPPPRATFLLTVAPELCNGLGNLHGGCATTIIDNLSSTLLLGGSRPGFYSLGGVSRNLTLTYLRPVPEGTEIRIVCEVVQTGRRLALLRGEIRKADDNTLCVVASHEKANTDDPESAKL
ncbi:hypothetical protein FQN54_002960 [Arachnomyces sp. PD_36]|nr:hypothetical protein FQN54_002960 [Arachnomyces sp. PD_36]